jgi:hypothetical protein
LGYNALIAIQSSSFLMTLKRKSIIHWKSHMFWYSFALFLSYSMIWKIKGTIFFLQMIAVFYCRTQLKMSKYVLWAMYALLMYNSQFLQSALLNMGIKSEL